MEFALDEIPSLLNGPLNDEDLYALCEKICIAVLELSQDAASKAVITRESVMLLPQGKIAIDIGIIFYDTFKHTLTIYLYNDNRVNDFIQ